MPSVCEISVDALCDSIAALKSREPKACVIVVIHWGPENVEQPSLSQFSKALELIAAGADAIIGHHSHTRMPVREINGKPVFFSLGNYIFDPQRSICQKALIAHLKITADSIEYEAIPITINRCRPGIITF